MADENIVAEPSAAATPVTYDNWDASGKPIVSKPPEPPPKQESEPAPTPEKKATPEPEGKSAAESGTAPKQEKKGKQTAEERIAELVSDRNRLEERLRKLETAPQPTSERKESAKPAELPKRPNPFKWTGTPEEFEQAQDAWEKHLRAQSVAEDRQFQQYQQIQQQTAELLKQTAVKYPDAETKVKATVTELVAKAPEFVQRFVNDSEIVTDLLYALSDEKTLNNVLEMAKTNPSKVLRVLRDMELDIQKAVKPAAKIESREPEKKASPDPDKPRAPKPPSEVGGRGTNLEDAQVAAARTGDFRTFEAEENRRKLVRA